jgi:hypothetical protein
VLRRGPASQIASQQQDAGRSSTVERAPADCRVCQPQWWVVELSRSATERPATGPLSMPIMPPSGVKQKLRDHVGMQGRESPSMGPPCSAPCPFQPRPTRAAQALPLQMLGYSCVCHAGRGFGLHWTNAFYLPSSQLLAVLCSALLDLLLSFVLRL